MSLLRTLYHWARWHYYRVALNNVHPTNPDIVLISRRLCESRAVVKEYLHG